MESIPENHGQRFDLYMNPGLAREFAQIEDNPRHLQVSRIMDLVMTREIQSSAKPWLWAELGGGAHPDRYDELFAVLLGQPEAQIHWVDASSYMLDLGKETLKKEGYDDRLNRIRFEQADMLVYLENLPNGSVSLASMKYTMDYVEDLDGLFRLLAQKLKPSGCMVATASRLSGLLPVRSTNASFVVEDKAGHKRIPKNDEYALEGGDRITIRFFERFSDPSSYLKGGEAVTFYHSREKIERLATKHGFQIFLGDWKKLVSVQNPEDQSTDQNVLVLRKPDAAIGCS